MQAESPKPSIWQANVEPPSEDEKVNVPVEEFDGLAGPLSMVVFGAVVSTVHVELAGVASVLPAASVARTSNV